MFFPLPRLLLCSGALCLAVLAFAGTTMTGEAAGSKKRDPSIAVRFHTQEAGYDPTFAARVKIGNPPREVIVEKIPSLSERDIASFYPYRAADGSYSAVIKLDRHGEATLEALSSEKRGSLIVVLVNGRPIASLLIDKIIRDGIIFIPTGLSEENIKSMGASFDVLGEPIGSPKNRKGKPLADTTEPSGELPGR